MKKFFTLSCLVAMVVAAFAGNNYGPVDHSGNALRPAPYAAKRTFQTSSSRAASVSFLLDYDGNDQQYSTDNGYDYSGYLWGINKNYSNTDNLQLDYAATYFDTLQFLDANNAITFIPLAQATLTLDSFVIAFIHNNTTNSNDSIRFTVFQTDQATYTGYGTPQATFTTPSLWDTLIVTNSSIPLNTTNYTFATFAPGITLPQGKAFGIRADFSGDTANKFNVVAGYRDQCAAACAAEISVAGNNAAYYLNLTTGGGSNLSGYFENDGLGAIYYDCDQSSGFTDGACENFEIQNFWMFAYTTASVNYGAVITADSTRGCPGATLNLSANAFGSASPTYTYQWASTSGTLTSTSDQQVGLVIAGNATVTVTVTDGNNLTTTASINVTSRGINLTITNANPLEIACGGSATITTQVSGTTQGRIYNWSTGASGANVSTQQISTPGNYSVTVTNNSGCSATASLAVKYPNGITNQVSFSNPPAPLCEDRALTFTNNTVQMNGWTPTWTFGDGNVGFTSNGVNTYANPGVYTVSLQVDSAGCIFKSNNVNITVLAASNAACVTGIEDVTFANTINMLPNPTNGNVTISVNGVEKSLSIRVFNIIGSEVKAFNATDIASTFNRTFDYSDLPNGTYLVKIQSADKTAVKRLTVSK